MVNRGVVGVLHEISAGDVRGGEDFGNAPVELLDGYSGQRLVSIGGDEIAQEFFFVIETGDGQCVSCHVY